ncbi:MAG: hypothetical protein L6263_05055 [Desulfobacteraceae bacterium]|nr:hypothetical protein [Desulfobacteraceae bacterium]
MESKHTSKKKSCWMRLPNRLKFPQTWVAISVLIVCLSLYFHLKGFELWSDIPWRDIRFITEFILIVLVIPALAYVFGLYYYTCAVITVKDDKNTSYSIVTDGKSYCLSAKKPHIKIYFSRKGKHSIYLYDGNDMVGDGPQKANTYEHHIDYVEFPK